LIDALMRRLGSKRIYSRAAMSLIPEQARQAALAGNLPIVSPRADVEQPRQSARSEGLARDEARGAEYTSAKRRIRIGWADVGAET
jgi:hypothetical protein